MPGGVRRRLLDPAACFSEALANLPSGGGGGEPQIPGTGMLLEQICPSAAAGELGPTTPIECLSELGSGFGGLEDLLGALGGEGGNPLTGQLCPAASEGGQPDPAACFMEALEGLPGALPLPGGDGGGTPEIPGADQLLGQICPATADDEIGPTTPVDCLTEAGGNLDGLQDLLGGLGGSNPLTDALCPAASGGDQLDPAACLTEALGNLPGAPGGDGGVPEIPGLGDGLSQICPNASAGEAGPTTPLECLMEAGGNFGQLEDLLGGLGGGNPLTDALCPVASGADSWIRRPVSPRPWAICPARRAVTAGAGDSRPRRWAEPDLPDHGGSRRGPDHAHRLPGGGGRQSGAVAGSAGRRPGRW
ncbi:hypothetical protein HML84_03985 [Alcanivorax sp. IO_7]|nr:hypothetical protein HML84_03985 [Alcanivorax sp. IO_7]